MTLQAHERVYPKYGFAQYKTSVGMFRWGSQRAKELSESSTSGWYKDAEGKPQPPRMQLLGPRSRQRRVNELGKSILNRWRSDHCTSICIIGLSMCMVIICNSGS